MAQTKDEFMADLLKGYEDHLVAVREGREEAYSYLRAEGVDYNDYLEHRHGWPVTEDGLCGPSSVGDACCDEHNQVYEVEFDECATCPVLIRMYEAKEARDGE